MSTIVTIASSDVIANSRTDINTNFSNLNTDKIETSTLDTDTALAANSDSKIATQKAVKTYIDTSGGANASTTVRGIVEEATSAEMIAGTAAGATGARLFLNPSLIAETGADKVVKTKSTGKLDASIIPASSITSGTISKDISSATTSTIAHGLGVAPTLVKITGVTTGGSTDTVGLVFATYVASTQVAVYVEGNTGTGTGEAAGAEFRISKTAGGGDYTTGTITVDATNISIAWSLTSSPTGTAYIIWEAYK